jgi:hypothetical protein
VIELDNASVLDPVPKNKAKEIRITAEAAWLWLQVV